MSKKKNCSVLDKFLTYLELRNYCPSKVPGYLNSVSHYLGWLELLSQEEAPNPQTVRLFLENHLPHCKCKDIGPKNLMLVRAALNQFLLMQGHRRSHLITDHGPLASIALIHEYDMYMDRVCGLSESTRWYRRRYAIEFITAMDEIQIPDFAKMTAATITQFVTKKVGSYKTGSIQVMANSIRGFIKFLQFSGRCSNSLIFAVPKTPNWSLARLPKSLDQFELNLFLAAFDRSTNVGKRDYAMARCFADLGLRCCEVTMITLDDFDWQQGLLILHRTKSKKFVNLPLPQKTGEALVDYIRNGRPASQSRAVFVYHQAPLGRGVRLTTVRGAMRRNFERVGLPWSGTQVFRHTIATQMIQSGACLKEIADLLGHQSIDTTMIYAKLDLPHLEKVSLPWPGRIK